MMFMQDDPRYKSYKIGKYTYGDPTIWSYAPPHFRPNTLEIGAFTSIAHGVEILMDGQHPINNTSTYPFDIFFLQMLPQGTLWTKGPIKIGSDVWIGQRAFIRNGVTIGDGAIVGAHSVVTKDVEPYSIVAGNPIRHIRYRFTELWPELLPHERLNRAFYCIEQLKLIKWWDWPNDKIRDNLDLIYSDKVWEFVQKFKVT